MPTIDSLVRDFLSQKHIAVVGVSDRRDTGCNLAYNKFKNQGYTVYAVNPHIARFQGAPCYPNLKSIPKKPDAVFILTSPTVTERIVEECVALGITHVWMHCLMGVKPGLAAGLTSVSPAAVQLCRENGITVIPGACPNQYLNPDGGHAFMRGLWQLLGFMKMPGSAQ